MTMKEVEVLQAIAFINNLADRSILTDSQARDAISEITAESPASIVAMIFSVRLDNQGLVERVCH